MSAPFVLAARCARDVRGTVMVEYALLLVLVALGLTAALIVCGRLLLRLFLYQQALVLLPFP
jgi:Flp pilus assembly pilin Flp